MVTQNLELVIIITRRIQRVAIFLTYQKESEEGEQLAKTRNKRSFGWTMNQGQRIVLDPACYVKIQQLQYCIHFPTCWY